MSAEQSFTTGKELCTKQKEQLETCLRFKEVMSSKTSIIKHRIKTKENSASCQVPYWIPYAYRQAVDTELRDMVKEGIIEFSMSDWASPMVIVKKNDRICVDYRKLNSETEVDVYPMPRIDDLD